MKNKKKVFDNFDVHAKDYREIHNDVLKISGGDTSYFSEHKVLELCNLEKKKDPLNILDFGCGDGTTMSYFKKHFSNSKLTGIDVSSKSIQIAKNRKIPGTHFDSYDGRNVPFENNTFDIVFTAVVFHHIDFELHDHLISEIERILKPGGRFYIFEHNPNNPITMNIVNNCEFDVDAVLLKPDYTKKLIIKSKLNFELINYILFFPRISVFNFFIKLERYLKNIPVGGQYYVKALKSIN